MPKYFTSSEFIFSVKSFTASMLALYLALRIGLPRPFWAMTTAYIVSHPFSGAVRSKALYRVGGTILGSSAAVFMVPRMANAPELLTLALALWVAGCLFISLLDRTPRSYVFMLSGYTLALIGFPVVTAPSTVFDVAIARVEEIMLGITCATFIHSLVFPRSLGAVLLTRLDHAINDARQWTGDVLRGVTGQATRDRRKLAGDITELRLMSTHLPFDTSHLRWTSSAIRALQDRLSAIVPLLSGIEDRLTTLQRISDEEISPRWRQLLNDIAAWSEGAEKTTPESGMQLRNAVDEITPPIQRDASWGDVIKVNLAARLRRLIDVGEECRNLRHHIENGFHGIPPGSAFRYGGTSPNVLHRDYRLALMSSFAAAVAIIACCAFWIATAWPAGSAAAMMCAVFCCLFATQDDPVAGLKPYMQYTLLSIPFSALYLLGILPAVHGFEMVILTTAPVFIITGIYIGRPETTGRAMAFLFGVTGTLSMQDTGNADLVSFINSMLGQLAGLGAAVLFTRLFRTVSAEWTARRLMRAGWAELADMSTTTRPPTVAMVSARMLDRVGLLTPRLALTGPQEDWEAVDVLSDLRIGLNMTQLLHARPQLATQGVALQPVLSELSGYFRRRLGTASTPATQAPLPTQPALLKTLDDTLRAVCAAPTTPAQNEAVAALVGIRRDLFPEAPHYQPVGPVTEEMTS